MKVALDLTTSALVSNAESHSSLRPKRRAHIDPLSEKTFPPVKKASSLRFKTYPFETSSSYSSSKLR